MLRLYSFWRSSASWRVRIALAAKGLEYEYVPVDLKGGSGDQYGDAYRAVNPEARVPTLEVDGQAITQSMAILEWLEERYPAPALLPADAFGRARVRGLAQLVAADIQPLQNVAVTKYLRETLKQDDRAVAAWLAEWIGRGLRALEARLARDRETGQYCHGDSPTLADVCLVPQAGSARRFGVETLQFPTITRIEQACLELPAFAAAAPERQPDAQ
jgi:maleylpyruvate isomerase